nr:MAG TPA: hypothetical protein [Caudoviricetes sp.]
MVYHHCTPNFLVYVNIVTHRNKIVKVYSGFCEVLLVVAI